VTHPILNEAQAATIFRHAAKIDNASKRRAFFEAVYARLRLLHKFSDEEFNTTLAQALVRYGAKSK
jgi:hypothetical protein